ncbi:hypothetical protein [Aureimonas sp. N4]|nr:hypothetical protein [Aureimonas sp. N4]
MLRALGLGSGTDRGQLSLGAAGSCRMTAAAGGFGYEEFFRCGMVHFGTA